MYLIDSDRTASYLNGRPDAVALIESLERERRFISVMTYGEVYEGIYFGRNPEASERVFIEMLSVTDILPLTAPILQAFARVRGTLRQQGLLIPDADLLIAATALHHDLVLITGNRRHFERIPELALYPA